MRSTLRPISDGRPPVLARPGERHACPGCCRQTVTIGVTAPVAPPPECAARHTG